MERGETDFSLHSANGEVPAVSLHQPIVDHINKLISKARGNEHIELAEHGLHPAGDTSVEPSAKQGMAEVYIRTRNYTAEHKTEITVATIALGTVLAGAMALKHRRK